VEKIRRLLGTYIINVFYYLLLQVLVNNVLSLLLFSLYYCFLLLSTLIYVCLLTNIYLTNAKKSHVETEQTGAIKTPEKNKHFGF